MASGTITVVSNADAGNASLPVAWTIGNNAQACGEGFIGDPVAANTLYGATQAAADASAEALLTCETEEFPVAFNDTIREIVQQADGKVIIGGVFTTGAGESQPYLARFTRSGVFDPTFTPVLNGGVVGLRLLSGNRLLVLGGFTTVNGQSNRVRICILNLADGSLDPFVASLDATVSLYEGLGDAVELPGGDIVIVSSSFSSITTVNGGSFVNPRFIRFQSDGTHVTSFNPTVSGASGRVRGLLAKSNGQMICLGSFATIAGVNRYGCALLNDDGTCDTGFTATLTTSTEGYGALLLSDGYVLISGSFTTVNGTAQRRIAKINATTGALAVGFADAGFTGTATSTTITFLGERADGRLVVSHQFTAQDGASIHQVASCNADGTRDTDWPDLGADATTYGFCLLADGVVLLAHESSHDIAGETRNYLSAIDAEGNLLPDS